MSAGIIRLDVTFSRRTDKTETEDNLMKELTSLEIIRN